MSHLVQLAGPVFFSNVWLFDDGHGRKFLVDSGHQLERYALRLALAKAGVKRRGDLDGVLLTHRHSDHAGNARWLRERFGCPVICHALDAPALSGAEQPARLTGRKLARIHEEALCHFEDRWPARSPVDEVYDHGPWKWGFRVIHVPGHTEGSVMLYHEPSATLFSGDAILAGPALLRFIEWPRLAMPGFSLEVEECWRSVRSFLSDLPRVDALCSGHGPLLRAGVREKLLALAGE